MKDSKNNIIKNNIIIIVLVVIILANINVFDSRIDTLEISNKVQERHIEILLKSIAKG